MTVTQITIAFCYLKIKLNAATYDADGKLDAIRKKRGYSYEDEVNKHFQIK